MVVFQFPVIWSAYVDSFTPSLMNQSAVTPAEHLDWDPFRLYKLKQVGHRTTLAETSISQRGFRVLLAVL